MTGSEIAMELIGWIGAILLLIGYYLIQTKRVKHDNTAYLILNIVGSFGLFVNTLYHRAYPSVVTNLIWFVIGTVVAMQIMRGKPDELE